MAKDKSNKWDDLVHPVKNAKQRIAIFSKHFMECSYLGPQVHEKNIKTWRKDQIVRSETDIESLLSQGAPIEVFVKEDGVH